MGRGHPCCLTRRCFKRHRARGSVARRRPVACAQRTRLARCAGRAPAAPGQVEPEQRAEQKRHDECHEVFKGGGIGNQGSKSFLENPRVEKKVGPSHEEAPSDTHRPGCLRLRWRWQARHDHVDYRNDKAPLGGASLSQVAVATDTGASGLRLLARTFAFRFASLSHLVDVLQAGSLAGVGLELVGSFGLRTGLRIGRRGNV